MLDLDSKCFSSGKTLYLYKRVVMKNFEINCKKEADSYVLLKSGAIVKVFDNVSDEHNNVSILGKNCEFIKNVYDDPCDSSKFNIGMYRDVHDNRNGLKSWPLSEVMAKMWKMSLNNAFSFSPILHTYI